MNSKSILLIEFKKSRTNHYSFTLAAHTTKTEYDKDQKNLKRLTTMKWCNWIWQNIVTCTRLPKFISMYRTFRHNDTALNILIFIDWKIIKLDNKACMPAWVMSACQRSFETKMHLPINTTSKIIIAVLK